MRKDLVEAALGAASAVLFEDVIYTPVGGPAVVVEGAIFGVEIVDERFDMFGHELRDRTHFTRALKAKFPALAKGDLIDDGTEYRVLDVEAIGDGRFEILISLATV